MQATSPEFSEAVMMVLALPFVPVGIATLLPVAVGCGAIFGGFFGGLMI